MAAAFWPKLD